MRAQCTRAASPPTPARGLVNVTPWAPARAQPAHMEVTRRPVPSFSSRQPMPHQPLQGSAPVQLDSSWATSSVATKPAFHSNRMAAAGRRRVYDRRSNNRPMRSAQEPSQLERAQKPTAHPTGEGDSVPTRKQGSGEGRWRSETPIALLAINCSPVWNPQTTPTHHRKLGWPLALSQGRRLTQERAPERRCAASLPVATVARRVAIIVLA